MSIIHIELSRDEAIKELKAMKLEAKDRIAWTQSEHSANRELHVPETWITGQLRRIEALHLAIAALDR